jgi:hypothetical protein
MNIASTPDQLRLSYPLHRYFLLGKQIEFSLGNASQQLSARGRVLAAQS